MKSNPCCEWKGLKDSKGYGVIILNGKQYKAHRLAVLLSGRKYPKGMVTDHLCRNRACINPDHLEVVTNTENVMRGTSFSVKNANKTLCIRGHILDGVRKSRRNPKNLERYCKLCKEMSNLQRDRSNKKQHEK